jgi:hypothetical protein
LPCERMDDVRCVSEKGRSGADIRLGNIGTSEA